LGINAIVNCLPVPPLVAGLGVVGLVPVSAADGPDGLQPTVKATAMEAQTTKSFGIVIVKLKRGRRVIGFNEPIKSEGPIQKKPKVPEPFVTLAD